MFVPGSDRPPANRAGKWQGGQKSAAMGISVLTPESGADSLKGQTDSGRRGAKNCVGVPYRDGDEVNGNEEAGPPCSQKS